MATSGESNGSWGLLAAHDTEQARVWDGFAFLPEPGENAALDAFCDRKRITIPSLGRLGARLSDTTVLAFAYEGGLKYRDIVTGRRWNFIGSDFKALRIVPRQRAHPDELDIALVAEGETDAARLTLLYPEADVAVMPGGARYFPAEYVDQLNHGAYDLVLVALDNDSAGNDGAAKIAEHLANAQRFAPPAGDWCETLDTEAPPLPTELETRPLPGRTAYELRTTTPKQTQWLIPGVIAPGWTVKIAAREKVGKGTLVAYLLGCLERDEDTVFGPSPGHRVTSLILTEEPEESIREKVANVDLNEARIIYGWEVAKLTWEAKADLLINTAADHGYELVFIDNISRTTNTEDENGTELARKVEYLSDKAKSRGISVLFDHHHKKGGGKVEDKSRGGTALGGATDNNIDMVRKGDWTSRQRTLFSRGRKTATIWEKTIELSPDGKTYTETEESQSNFHHSVLKEYPDGVTVADFAERIKRSTSTAGRALEALVSQNRAERLPKRGNANVYGYCDEPQLTDEPTI